MNSMIYPESIITQKNKEEHDIEVGRVENEETVTDIYKTLAVLPSSFVSRRSRERAECMKRSFVCYLSISFILFLVLILTVAGNV